MYVLLMLCMHASDATYNTTSCLAHSGPGDCRAARLSVSGRSYCTFEDLPLINLDMAKSTTPPMRSGRHIWEGASNDGCTNQL